MSYLLVFGRPFLKQFDLCYRTIVCLVLSICDGVLWPNDWMDQDATWHGGRPQPRPHCVRCGPSSPPPKRGTAAPSRFSPCLTCLLWPKCWMYQDATWYGGRPRSRPHCARWGPSSPPKRGTAPNFRPMSVVAKRLDGSRCHLVRRQALAQETLS